MLMLRISPILVHHKYQLHFVGSDVVMHITIKTWFASVRKCGREMYQGSSNRNGIMPLHG